jgi:hypothetical protein
VETASIVVVFTRRRSQWTTDTLKEHFDALREADQRALQIKEEADKVALQLARENQKLKEQQHNNVLEQWKDERGDYATKHELASAIEKVQVERRTGGVDARTLAVGVLLVIAAYATTIVLIAKP